MIGCLTLYDFDVNKIKIKECMAYGENWMTENDYPPNTMGLPHSGKYLRYSNGKRRLEKEDYQERIDFVTIYGGGEPGTDNGWKLSLCIENFNKTICLCFEEEDISFSYENLEKFLVALCQFCSPHYAIGFERERKYGPNFYALGHSHGLKLAYENEEHGKERDRIYKWIDAYQYSKSYRTGDLRDVYRFNVLSQPHMDRLVNNQRFEEWVQASSGRGTLKKISETLWTWWIEPQNISTVREALAPTGMILCL